MEIKCGPVLNMLFTPPEASFLSDPSKNLTGGGDINIKLELAYLRAASVSELTVGYLLI